MLWYPFIVALDVLAGIWLEAALGRRRGWAIWAGRAALPIALGLLWVALSHGIDFAPPSPVEKASRLWDFGFFTLFATAAWVGMWCVAKSRAEYDAR
ncbi:MAG: hypothetical protein H0W72_01145 [Planctomycetes bacterium]|nr:hypothetical protein [Planctomycetota bacterium]